MTKAEKFDKAWRMAIREKDFSLVDAIYHSDYKGFDNYLGVEVNLDADKSQMLAYFETIYVGPQKTISEDEEHLKVHRYHKFKDEEIFSSITTSITLKDGKIIKQESVFEELDYDPSEGQDWNWEDYE